MAANVAKSASRALGLVVYKSKLNGGFSYECFTKLYNSSVWPMTTDRVYGAQTGELVSKLCKIGHVGISWQLENIHRILLNKYITTFKT